MHECKCKNCEMLSTNEPIKVVPYVRTTPFEAEICYFVDGYKCLYNGIESLHIDELCKGKCRLALTE